MTTISSLLEQEEKINDIKTKTFRIPVGRLFDEEKLISLYRLGYGLTSIDFRFNHGLIGLKYVTEMLKKDSEIIDVIFITRKRDTEQLHN